MNVLARVRKICLALPDAVEKIAWSAPTFRVKDGAKDRMFAMFSDDHHGDGRTALWLKGAPGAQESLVESNAEVFFVPPYVGPGGWIGVRLDRGLDWDVVAGLVREAWLEAAPKKVRAALLGEAVPTRVVASGRARAPKMPARRPARKPAV